MAAAKYTIQIDAYSGYALDIACKDANQQPVNLTGYTGTAQIRQTVQSSSTLVTFVVTFTPASGLVHLTLSATETAKLQNITDAVWDLFITPPAGQPNKLMYGNVKITPAVTR